MDQGHDRTLGRLSRVSATAGADARVVPDTHGLREHDEVASRTARLQGGNMTTEARVPSSVVAESGEDGCRLSSESSSAPTTRSALELAANSWSASSRPCRRFKGPPFLKT